MSDSTKSSTSTEFSVGPDYFFTKSRYSWISHANLAVWWSRSNKLFEDICAFCSSYVLVFACHVMILSGTTATPKFLFTTLVIIKKTYW